MYLISSLPRSGTRYMTDILKKMGSNAMHESDKPQIDGTVSSLHHHCFIKRHPCDLAPVLHQTRHPLNWLKSYVRDDSHMIKWEKFGRPLLPFVKIDKIECGEKTGQMMLLMAWLRGHEFIETKENPVFRFKIEEMYYVSETMNKVVELLKIKPKEMPTVKFKGIHTSTGLTEGAPWDREDLEWPVVDGFDKEIALVKEKAREYGYTS